MTIPERILFLVCLSFVFIVPNTQAYYYNANSTHTAFGDTPGRIVSRSTAPEQTSFTVPYKIETMGIQQSSLGKLGYLEKTKEYKTASHMGTWVEAKKGTAPDQFAKLYKPDVVSYILHICDSKGTDIKQVPIAQRYETSFVDLIFCGENFVVFPFGGRLIPQASETFVDLRMDKIFSLYHEVGFMSWNKTLSPDGNTLLLSIEMKDEKLPHLLVANGRMVYPFLEKEAPFASDNPEEFDKKMARIRQYAANRKKQGKAIPVCFGMSNAMWSEDGRSFVLLERDGKRYRLLKFNLDAIAGDKPFEEYCKPLREIPSPEKDFSQEYGGLMGVRIVYDSKTEEVRLESRQKYLEDLKKGKP
ncbi:MAG TPA: hypothetical protein PKH31_11315 [Candidatus Sumerlaeota bacterium]|nr:hypothetical protein [Candidatus Sumerlaeota bacterium]